MANYVGSVRWRNLTPQRFFLFSFFFFFLYHVFIVFRYKKVRAALAKEKTKPINQKPQDKKPDNKGLGSVWNVGKPIASALQISKNIEKS